MEDIDLSHAAPKPLSGWSLSPWAPGQLVLRLEFDVDGVSNHLTLALPNEAAESLARALARYAGSAGLH